MTRQGSLPSFCLFTPLRQQRPQKDEHWCARRVLTPPKGSSDSTNRESLVVRKIEMSVNLLPVQRVGRIQSPAVVVERIQSLKLEKSLPFGVAVIQLFAYQIREGTFPFEGLPGKAT